LSEIKIFYEKSLKGEMYQQADFIEAVVAGIGGSFGGYKQVSGMIEKMRE
jgi:hypothetical protein